MTEIGTITARALTKTRGTSKYLYEEKDANILGIVNPILMSIYQALKSVESNLVYSVQTFDTVDGTGEYSPTTAFQDVLKVWITDTDDVTSVLKEIDEEHKILFDTTNVTARPQYYYLTEDAKIGLLDEPDAVYAAYMLYQPVFTLLTTLTGAGSTVPWKDIWNVAIEYGIVNEILEIQERPSQYFLARYQQEWSQAMNATLKLGTRRRAASDDMFENYDYEECW